MKAIARIAYRALLRLHPSAFRAEFGDEMLWIFDEEMRDEEMRNRARSESFQAELPMRLLLDGIRSVLLQHSVRSHSQQPQPESAGLTFCQIESAIPIVRFAQAGFVAFSCLFCLLSVAIVASMVVPKFLANQKGWFPTSVQVFYSAPNSKTQRSTH
jgi:hypothetical protein